MTIDPAAETARLVDSLGAERLALAASYTRGNEALTLVTLVVSLVVLALIARSRLLDRLSARLSGRGFAARTFTIAAVFLLADTVLGFPLTLWTGWQRERAYGLSSQPLGDFLGQQALAAGINAVIGGIFLLGLFALIRRTGRRWWLWGSGFAGLAIAVMLLAGPALLQPLFNHFQPVPAGPVRVALERIADDVGIPHDRIFLYDGSRQSDRFTANVSGIGPTARIAISDVALKSASLAEVRAVTGHEAGHYRLGHVWQLLGLATGLALLIFWLADRTYPRVAALIGCPVPLGDPVGLPALTALALVLTFLATPLSSTLSRSVESEADAYSLEHVGEPDALATALLKTAEYRYPRPGALEEAVFYDHPSVERRIRRAMEWKARHRATGGGAARP